MRVRKGRTLNKIVSGKRYETFQRHNFLIFHTIHRVEIAMGAGFELVILRVKTLNEAKYVIELLNLESGD